MSGNGDYVKIFPALNKVSNKLEAITTKRYSSNINQAFTVSVLDKKFDNGKMVNVENAKCVCKKIIIETGVGIEISTTKSKADMTFIFSGKQANVAEAKKMIVSSIKAQDKEVLFKRQPQNTINLDVPVKYRRSLIGINGDAVRDLCSKYNVQIVIPTKEEYNNIVTITGTQPKLKQVAQEIKTLMEEFDKKHSRDPEIKVDVPVRYRRSLIGVNGDTVRDLCNKYNVQIVIPTREEYNGTIMITGAQPKLEKVTQEIKEFMEEFDEKHLRAREIKIAKDSKKKALEENSVEEKTYIGEFPNPSESSESTNLENGRIVEKTYDQKFPVIPENNVLKTKNVEIDRKRQSLIITPKTVNQAFTISVKDHKLKDGEILNVGNARRICKEIIGTGVSIEISATKSQMDLTFIVSGKIADVLEAKKRIMSNILKQDKQVLFKRVPKKTINLDVPVRYRRSLIGINGNTVRDLCSKYEVKIVIPTKEEYNNIVTITGTQPKLEQVAQEINTLMEEFDKKHSRDPEIKLDVPVRYRRSLIGLNGNTVRDLCSKYEVKIVIPTKEEYNNIVTITGTQPKLEQVAQEIKTLMEEFDKKHSRDPEIKVDVPVRYRRSLIGVNGDTVRDLCNKYNVQIVIPTREEYNGTIMITGAQPKLEKVTQEIKEFMEEFDEKHLRAREIKIANDSKKKALEENSVEEKTYIGEFPNPSESSESTNLENGRIVEKTYDQKFPVIPENNVLKTKNVEIDRKRQSLIITPKTVNQAFTISVKDHKLKDGEILNVGNARRICKEIIGTGVSIEISATKSQMDLTFIVSGKIADVLEAKKRIMSNILKQDKQVLFKREPKKTINLDVPVRYRRSLIGINGNTVRDLCSKYEVKIVIPTKEEYNNIVTITGTQPKLEQVAQEIKTLMEEFDKKHSRDPEIKDKDIVLKREPKKTINLDVPVKYRRLLIGLNGTTIRDLCNKYKVKIVIPTREEYDDKIKITGTQPKLVQVIQVIKELMEDFDNKTIQPCGKTLMRDFQNLQDNPSDTSGDRI